MPTCTKCKDPTLTDDDFSRIRKDSDKRRPACKKCTALAKATKGSRVKHKNAGALVTVKVPCYNDGNGTEHVLTAVTVSNEDHEAKRYPRKICLRCKNRIGEIDTSTEHLVAI